MTTYLLTTSCHTVTQCQLPNHIYLTSCSTIDLRLRNHLIMTLETSYVGLVTVQAPNEFYHFSEMFWSTLEKKTQEKSLHLIDWKNFNSHTMSVLYNRKSRGLIHRSTNPPSCRLFQTICSKVCQYSHEKFNSKSRFPIITNKSNPI